jgi:hypothetical protein
MCQVPKMWLLHSLIPCIEVMSLAESRGVVFYYAVCGYYAVPINFIASIFESLTFPFGTVMEMMVITNVFNFHLQFQNVTYPV